MKRVVLWAELAADDLVAIPNIDDAAAVDSAVQYFARTGIGFLRRVEAEQGPTELRLYATGTKYYAVVRFDDQAVYVWRLVRYAR